MIQSWLTTAEIIQYSEVGDEYINGLFQEVRTISQQKYLLQEGHREIKGFLRKTVTECRYTLYMLMDDDGTVMVINFCQDHKWSINTSVSRSYMISYLLGILAGYHICELYKK